MVIYNLSMAEFTIGLAAPPYTTSKFVCGQNTVCHNVNQNSNISIDKFYTKFKSRLSSIL